MKRQGFTLVELLVSLLLLSLAMLLLFQGAIALSETMVAGRRQSAMDRSLRSALTVIREDLEQMLVAEEIRLDIFLEPETPLRFRRLRQQATPESDVEWVEYRIQDHPQQDGLRQLLRRSAPDEFEADSLEWSEEILVDALISVQFWMRFEPDSVPQLLETQNMISAPPLSMDVLLALTEEPFPFVLNPADGILLRVGQFQGIWERIRVQPRIQWIPRP